VRFGAGYRDICIENDCDLEATSEANMWYNFESVLSDRNASTPESRSYLAGSEKFKVVELEVFHIALLEEEREQRRIEQR
jgi:hypothetical protein